VCGIAGYWGCGDRGVLAEMTERIAHRGPDAEGFFECAMSGVGLGHRRLSIIDLATGGQPMASGDGSLRVVFNGEIYNHRELRAELEAAGCHFASDHSDTEVLLHGYRMWGDDFVKRLNGMWAFAIWDSAKRRMFLSRDRFGKKPLFWFYQKGTLAFASELKALMRHPLSPRSISARARRKFFAHALIPAPHSLVEGIFKLPGGCNMVIDEGGTPRVRRYWEFRLEPDSEPRAEAELADELLEILDRAVARRLISDVPLGVFLSGGIDSTAVAALAARHVDSIQTFCVGFNEPSFDESGYAAEAARAIGSVHRTEILDLAGARDLLPRLLAKVDEPQGDNSLLPTWLLSGFTRRHVTVALGGDGGDELFAGYDTFRGLAAAHAYERMVPRPMHAALRALAGCLPVSHSNLSLDFKIKRGMRGASYNPQLWNPIWLGALEPAEIAEYFGGTVDPEDVYSEAIGAWDACASTDLVDRTLEFYTKIYLQDGILAKVDRASMLNSLEARSPFLDIEVADFARRLPSRHKLRGNTTKWILKRALRGVVPDSLIDRKKKGFGTPVGAWFREGVLAPESRDPFVTRRMDAHRAGRSDERLFLWCQLSLEAWER
jgi:asparagine synthase (glutamine-hydrolysing)